MQKTYIEINNVRFALYTGIESVYGGFLLETNGGATCLNELEEADASELIESINAIIADPDTPWEALSDEDTQYISDTLESWGLR